MLRVTSREKVSAQSTLVDDNETTTQSTGIYPKCRGLVITRSPFLPCIMNENFHLISDALTFTTAKLARAAPRLESLTHHTTDGIQLISSCIILAEISLNRADEFSALNYSETLLK